MKIRKLEEAVKSASRRRAINDTEIQNAKKYIEIVIKRIKEIIKEEDIKTEEELRKYILDKEYKDLVEYTKKSSIIVESMKYLMIGELINQEDDIKEIFNKIKSNPQYLENSEGDCVFSLDFKKSKEDTVGSVYGMLISTRREIDNNSKSIRTFDNYNNASQKEKERILHKLKLSSDKEKIFKEKAKEISLFRSFIEELDSNPEKSIYKYLKAEYKDTEEALKKAEIDLMDFLFERFEEYNLLEVYKKLHDKKLIESGLGEEYGYELTTGETKGNIGIKETFKREYLETIDLDSISMIVSFWLNRYAKENKSLCDAIFAVDTLNLWHKILKDEDIDLSDELINDFCCKRNCIKKITDIFHEYIASVHRDEEKKDGVLEIQTEEEEEKIVNQEEANYKRIFDEILPESENNLLEDLDTYKIISNKIMNIYNLRDTLICCKMRNLLTDKKTENWGVVLSEYTSKINNILIAIDYEGFNMPVRFHVSREFLERYLLKDNKSVVPIYEGEEDFNLNNGYIPTHVFMPLQKRQKTHIREICKNIGSINNARRKNLLEHIRFLCKKEKYPEHLKDKNGKRPCKRKLNLVTGEIFYDSNKASQERDKLEVR